MMLSSLRKWVPIAALAVGVQGMFGKEHYPPPEPPINSTIEVCRSNVTVFDTTTIWSATTLPVTHYVNVTVSDFETETKTVEKCVTKYSTTTINVSITETESETVTDTESKTITDTESETITRTTTTTDTVPATITTYTTKTVISTFVDPCPTTCKISVDTVNLFFWPSDRPYTYPSTYVDTSLDYTFTSPSVYMLIPTARGTNSLGPAGPSTTSWILALDLDEVSTIEDKSITRQLVLSDLGTDCPQTADPSAIATMDDPRCDPILAAPKQVKSWASPCNACGNFGLFDPPYAVPTLPGGLLGTTTHMPEPVHTSAPAPKPTRNPDPNTSQQVPAESPPNTSQQVPPESPPASSTEGVPTTSDVAVVPTTSAVSVVPGSGAGRMTGSLLGLVSCIMMAVFLL